MSVQIGTGTMTSDTTTASACQCAAVLALWEVSWLPSRVLNRDEAITALMLAEAVERGSHGTCRGWSLLQILAGELGLSTDEAVDAVLESG